MQGRFHKSVSVNFLFRNTSAEWHHWPFLRKQQSRIPCHSCASNSPGLQGVIPAQAAVPFYLMTSDFWTVAFAGSDTIEALSGENQRGPPFG